MKVITTDDLIRDVADKWRRQYHALPESDPRYKTWLRLDALDPATATKTMVDNIIGNTSWTALVCSECHQDVDEVVQVGDSDDGPEIFLCYDCLDEACVALSKLSLDRHRASK